MSSLHVPAHNRRWVFETLASLMKRSEAVEDVRLSLGGPDEGASIFWISRDKPFPHRIVTRSHR